MTSEGATEEQKTAVEDDANNQRLKDDNAAVELAEDTASSSSRDEEEERDSEDDDGDSSVEEEEEEEEPMPLLSYTRLFGSLPRRPTENSPSQPRTFSVPSTCAVMGQVILSPEDPTTTSAAAAATSSPDSTSASDPRSSTGLATTPDQRRQATPAPVSFYGDPLLSQQPHFVVATGFADGSIALVDARTAVAVVPSDQLRLRDASHAESVVDLSIDSSGTFLAAVDEGRMACIWEFRYTISLQSATTSNSNSSSPSSALSPVRDSQPSQAQHPSPSTPSDAGVFSSFMSAWTGATPPTSATTNAPASATRQTNPTSPATTSTATAPANLSAPRLATSSVQMSRISYPRSFGVPTCIAIDPSYKRKREKAVLTGFLDGRLVMTKRGFVFQRRTDAIIYQGTYDGNSHGGIEAIEWRGSLAAWADARYD